MNTMKTYEVNIDYKKAPAFGTSVLALNEAQAKRAALYAAEGCGFTAMVKKITVKEVAA